jgi:alpha-N-arabinofuranosidase
MAKMPLTDKNKIIKPMKKINQISLMAVIALFYIISISAQENNSLIIKTTEGKDTISKNLYGQFAEHLGHCIYDGIWVGEKSNIPNVRGFRSDIIDALKVIEIPVIRWPGGCFADTYHWKDGIGPKESRPKMVNSTWGGVVEDNSFGTHEFLEFCSLIGAEPYLAVNVGSGTVREAVDWIEYVTANDDSPMAQFRRKNGRQDPWKVKYWGIGNESWGCGGNMDPYFYTSLFKQYSTFCHVPYRIASGGLNFDMNWTETFMKNISDKQGIAQGYSFHYYSVCHDWTNKGSSTNFDTDEWYLTMKAVYNMQTDLENQIKVMDKYDPQNKVALIADEWGNWYDVEPGTNPAFLFQQNTLRDAISAAFYLNMFNNHCQRVKMANIAQLVNVLQSMILTQGDKMVLTPTYYVFKMFKIHQDAVLLPVDLKCNELLSGETKIPSISVSASKAKNGVIHVTLANIDAEKEHSISCNMDGIEKASNIKGEIITSEKMDAYNDFNKTEEINIKDFTGFKTSSKELKIILPAKSVICISITPKYIYLNNSDNAR